MSGRRIVAVEDSHYSLTVRTMSSDSNSSAHWDVLAAELRAYRDQQKQTWGELDHALIGRYLAGEVSTEERTQVEAALEQHPELRMLTEVVSDVLVSIEPRTTAIEPAGPRILAFTPNPKSKWQRFRQRTALAAAACLLLGLGFLLKQHSGTPEQSDAHLPTGPMFASRDASKGSALTGEPHGSVRLMKSGGVQEIGKGATPLLAPSQQTALADFRARFLTRVAVNLGERLIAAVPAPATDSHVGEVTSFKMDTTTAGEHHSLIVPAAAPAQPQDIQEWFLNKVVDGVKQQQDPALQERSAKLIARMGPAASNAVPELVNTLQQSNSTQQQVAIVSTLGDLGPNARYAARELESLCVKGCKEVQPRAREALRHVRAPAWIGVRDRAGVLSADARQRIDKRLRELSATHHIALVAETVPSLSESQKKQYFAYDKKSEMFNDLARKRSHQVGGDRGVYLLICVDPPAVQVKFGSEAASKTAPGWNTNGVYDRMEKSLKARDYDQGLEDVVKMIEKAVTK